MNYSTPSSLSSPVLILHVNREDGFDHVLYSNVKNHQISNRIIKQGFDNLPYGKDRLFSENARKYHAYLRSDGLGGILPLPCDNKYSTNETFHMLKKELENYVEKNKDFINNNNNNNNIKKEDIEVNNYDNNKEKDDENEPADEQWKGNQDDESDHIDTSESQEFLPTNQTPKKNSFPSYGRSASEIVTAYTLKFLFSCNDIVVQGAKRAKDVTITMLRAILRRRSRSAAAITSSALDIVKRRSVSFSFSDRFRSVRSHDFTSSFCQDKSFTFEDIFKTPKTSIKFFISRLADPTSYFFRYRLDNEPIRNPTRAKIELIDINWLKEHEEIESTERVLGLFRATLKWNAYIQSLLIDRKSGVILDGHHRYNVGKLLRLTHVPCVLVDYLEDDSISVDVWPKCGLDTVSKEEVIKMGMSNSLFPPKTSKHGFINNLPPIRVPLADLGYKKLSDSKIRKILKMKKVQGIDHS